MLCNIIRKKMGEGIQFSILPKVGMTSMVNTHLQCPKPFSCRTHLPLMDPHPCAVASSPI